MIPMLMAGRFARRARTGPRRSKVWVGAISSAATAIAPGATGLFGLITEASLEAQGKPTIARIRGTYNVYYDSAATSSGVTGAMIVTCGICLVSTKAFAAGIASVPLPITNVEFPWIWWDSVMVGQDVRSAVGFTEIGQTNRPIDSKAMRKVPPAHTLIFVFEATGGLQGAPDARLMFDTRILLLPS